VALKIASPWHGPRDLIISVPVLAVCVCAVRDGVVAMRRYCVRCRACGARDLREDYLCWLQAIGVGAEGPDIQWWHP